MIHFKHVAKSYPPDITGVQGIDLHILPGEFVSIVGQSGAGKSTLVKLLTAELRPDKGRIIIGGWDITRISRRDIPLLRRQIGVVFQGSKLLPKRTVFENVAFALEVCGEPYRKIREIVPQVLSVVGLDEKFDRYPRQLSGGEAQRVAIARALVHRPKVLIADEPTADLDPITGKTIIDLLSKINDFGTTLLLVTHNRDIVNMLRRRVITLDQGVVISDREAGKYFI